MEFPIVTKKRQDVTFERLTMGCPVVTQKRSSCNDPAIATVLRMEGLERTIPILK